MKRVFCPKCDNQLAFDETKYPEGKVLAFVCPQCGSQFKIKLGRKIVRTESGQEKEVKEPDFSCGYITVIENVFGFKQELPLVMGDNVIGRRNKDTAGVDVTDGTVTANVKLSAEPDNLLEAREDGLFVPALAWQTLDNE